MRTVSCACVAVPKARVATAARMSFFICFSVGCSCRCALYQGLATDAAGLLVAGGVEELLETGRFGGAEDLVRGAFFLDHALMQEYDTVADRAGEIHVMGHQHHGSALVGENL